MDAAGQVDPTPSQAAFHTCNQAPSALILTRQENLESVRTCIGTGPVVSLEATATDPDGDWLELRQAMVPLSLFEGITVDCITREEVEALDLSDLPASVWGEWKTLSVPPVLLESPARDPGTSHLILVQARDVHDTHSTTFAWGRQLAEVRIVPDRLPLLTVEEPTLGTSYAVGPNSVWEFTVPVGEDFEFSFEGDAGSYLSRVVTVRYGWNVEDLEDPGDPRWTSGGPDLSAAPPHRIEEGLNTFAVEVIDRTGALTRGVFRLTGQP